MCRCCLAGNHYSLRRKEVRCEVFPKQQVTWTEEWKEILGIQKSWTRRQRLRAGQQERGMYGDVVTRSRRENIKILAHAPCPFPLA